jgi:hypothetical protein
MKKYILIGLLILIRFTSLACPGCEAQQPKLLRGVVHGTGPESKWDYIIMWIMVLIVLFTLFYSIKWLIWPGEKSKSHIKYFVLNNE